MFVGVRLFIWKIGQKLELRKFCGTDFIGISGFSMTFLAPEGSGKLKNLIWFTIQACI
jgi:hypothetical protein